MAFGSSLRALSDASFEIIEFCQGVPGKVTGLAKSLKLPLQPVTAVELIPPPALTRMPFEPGSVLDTVLAALVSFSEPPIVTAAAGTALRDGRSFKMTLIF